MKKILLVVLSIVCLCMSVSCSITKDDSEITLHEKAVEVGSKLLREKFPDSINNKSKFIAYQYLSMWHVQNIFTQVDNTETVDKEFCQISDIKYVKLNSDCTEIISYGDYQNEYSHFDTSIPVDYITDSEVAKTVAKSVLDQVYEFETGLIYELNDSNEDYYQMETIVPPWRESIYVHIRKSDGMIINNTQVETLYYCTWSDNWWRR